MTSENSATPKSAQSLNSSDLIAQARSLYEQANELLLQAGQLFEQAKETSKRKFNKLLREHGLDPKETNKLIKASITAKGLQSSTAPKLGLMLLLRLAFPSNAEALEAIAQQDCSQLEASELLKKHHQPAKPKETPQQVEWHRHKDGSRTLVLRLPDGDIAVKFEQTWKEKAVPLPIFINDILSDRTSTTFDTQPTDIYLQATQELLESDENQSALVVLLEKIQERQQDIQRWSDPQDATERMMLRKAREELKALQEQLAILNKNAKRSP
ncbi:MAG: hypothetical protein SAK29_16225 [Scytonema sp. PMC 1069.18]|nr:hypothetical protein [Scytonema sp. PMC 1069.18]MEC4883043.1 hypothetical protein [Scytonema sp. PMC 1070.18]